MSGYYKYRPQYTQNTLGSSPEDNMETRATTHDADDPDCAKCGHPLSFHVRADMIAVQPCDYSPDEEMKTLCGCTSWAPRD